MAASKATPLQWRTIHPTDAGRPEGRWGHSMCLVADKYIVVVGGLQAGRTLNDTWVFSVDTCKWARCLVSGTPPTPRWGHSVTLVSSHTLLLLGGREGSKPMSMGEYYELDLKTMVWAKYETLKPAPRSRYAHGAVSLGMSARQVLIFGGHGGRSRYYSDVHVLQLPLQQTAAGAGAEPSDASQITVGAIQPASQQHHGAGSILSSILPSSWLRNIGANRDSDSDDDDAAHRRSPSQPGSQAFWLSPQVNGVPPTKRSGHTSTLIGSKLFIIGGYNGKDILNDLRILHLPTWTWSAPIVAGSGIPPLVGHSADAVPESNQIVVFGGSVSATELSCSIYVIDTEFLASTALHQAQAPEARFWHRSVVLSSLARKRPLQPASTRDAPESSSSWLRPEAVNSSSDVGRLPDLNSTEPLTDRRPLGISGASSANDVFVVIFGGSGEKGQAQNDLQLLDVSALAHGEDLTETLALAPASSTSAPPQRLAADGRGGLDVPGGTDDSDKNSGLAIGLVTKRATAPSMAVGMGGIGKVGSGTGTRTGSMSGTPTAVSGSHDLGSESDLRSFSSGHGYEHGYAGFYRQGHGMGGGHSHAGSGLDGAGMDGGVPSSFGYDQERAAAIAYATAQRVAEEVYRTEMAAMRRGSAAGGGMDQQSSDAMGHGGHRSGSGYGGSDVSYSVSRGMGYSMRRGAGAPEYGWDPVNGGRHGYPIADAPYPSHFPAAGGGGRGTMQHPMSGGRPDYEARFGFGGDYPSPGGSRYSVSGTGSGLSGSWHQQRPSPHQQHHQQQYGVPAYNRPGVPSPSPPTVPPGGRQPASVAGMAGGGVQLPVQHLQHQQSIGRGYYGNSPGMPHAQQQQQQYGAQRGPPGMQLLHHGGHPQPSTGGQDRADSAGWDGQQQW